MFPIMGLLFLSVLIAILFLLYKNEIIANKKSLRRAVAEEYWNGHERRRHTRFRKTLEVTYVIRKKPHLKPGGNGHTVDVSEGGVKLFLDEKLSKGDVMDLEISIPGIDKPAEVEGAVVWSEDAKGDDTPDRRFFYIGLKFSTIKQPRGNCLIEYIKSISLDPEAVKA